MEILNKHLIILNFAIDKVMIVLKFYFIDFLYLKNHLDQVSIQQVMIKIPKINKMFTI
jgi:hypothetical protein